MIFYSKDILKLLPHRAPFLFLDKVIECTPGKSAIGIKNVTIDEPCFSGHFPTEPIFPGSLTIESAAQTIAVMYGAEYLGEDGSSNLESVAFHIGYLVSVNMKFLAPILPGDTMIIKVKHKMSVQSLLSVDVLVEVNHNIVAKGNLGVSKKP